jgi:ribosomal protein S17E
LTDYDAIKFVKKDNMMSRVFVTIITGVLLISCTNKPAKLVVEDQWSYLKTEPSVAEAKYDSLTLRIKPIDPIFLNKELFKNSLNDGSFYSFSRSISIKEDIEEEYSNRLLKYLSTLNTVEEFDENQRAVISYKLINDYLGNDIAGEDFISEKFYDSDVYLYPSTANPFQIADKYLSVIELDFENNTDQVRSINIDNISIISAMQLIEPFKKNDLKNKIDSEKN